MAIVGTLAAMVLYGGRPIARPPEATLAIENWPICTATGIVGSDADWAQLDPDFAAGKEALTNSDWASAITLFKFAELRDPGNADIQNYIGEAYRRLERFGPAMGHFQKSLSLKPRHRGAHEHLGELYITLHDPDQAQQHLAALARICLVPCEEFDRLESEIERYRDLARIVGYCVDHSPQPVRTMEEAEGCVREVYSWRKAHE